MRGTYFARALRLGNVISTSQIVKSARRLADPSRQHDSLGLLVAAFSKGGCAIRFRAVPEVARGHVRRASVMLVERQMRCNMRIVEAVILSIFYSASFFYVRRRCANPARHDPQLTHELTSPRCL